MFWIKKSILCGVLSGFSLLAFMAVPLPYTAVKYLTLAIPEQFIPAMGTVKSASLLTSAIELKLQIEFQRILSDNPDKMNDKDYIIAKISNVRDLVITQRHLQGVKIAGGASTGQGLVRGFGYCDQINGVLALALMPSFERSDLFALSDGQYSPHSLVRLSAPQLGEIYADAWSDVPVFQIGRVSASNIPTFEAVKPSLQATLPRIDQSYLENGFVLNSYDFWYRVEKVIHRTAQRLLPFLMSSSLRMVSQPPAAERAAVSPFGDTQQGNSIETGGAVTETTPMHEIPDPALVEQYLIARLDHIYGRKAAALAGYDHVVASNCTDDFCRLAKEFSRRLYAAESLSKLVNSQ